MKKKLFLAILLATALGLSLLTFQKTSKSQHTWTTKQQRIENFIARQKAKGVSYSQNARFVEDEKDYQLVELSGGWPVDIRYETIPISDRMSFEEFSKKSNISNPSVAFALYQNGTEQVYSKEWQEDYAKAIDKGE